MNRTTVITVFLLLVGLVYFAAMAVAQPTGPSSISAGTSERANITSSAKAAQAQAGNVTALNIDTTSITTAWQGYYGNISGSITLEDVSGSIFYNWSGLGSISGEVYASRSNAVDWGTINCSNVTENDNEDSFLGKTASDPDNVGGTFSALSHPAVQVGSLTLGANTCNSTNAYNSGGAGGSDFYQVLLADGSSNMVYTTIIDENTAGFNGATHDFQLLVGENGNETSSGSTTYYFYIELS